MTQRLSIALIAFGLVLGCTPAFTEEGSDGKEKTAMDITVESPSIKEGKPIPVEFTADGEDVSPPLSWSGLPESTEALALICDDPDAPMPQPWVHWVIYNIPAGAKGLPRALPADAVLDAPADLKGATQGPTGWGKPGYRGPAPPKGKVHHYHFTLYALDAGLDLKPGLNKDKLLAAIEGHVIGKGELIGTYER